MSARADHRILLAWQGDELPSPPGIAKATGAAGRLVYLEADGWRVTCDPRDDKPWAVWQPEADSVRDLWGKYRTLDRALDEVRDRLAEGRGPAR